MTWRDNLRPGSFRGVPFFVERARTELRIFAHEQTFPDRTAAERAIRVVPLGHGPRRFSVSAYVIGDDYMERRDALEAALQQPGPGRLVHPYRGDRTVSIVNVIRTEESPRAGGRASIEFTCVDVSEAALASRADTQAIVDRDVDAFISELADEFDASYLEEATDSSIAAESVRRFNGASSALRGASQAISQQLGVIDNFANRVRAFEGDLTRIVAAPSAAARAFLGAVGAVAGLPASVIDAAVQSIASVRTVVDDTLDAFAPLARYGRNEPPLPAVSGGDQAQLRLVDAVNTLVRGAAIFESARAIGT
ncbi:MAG: DNA circularization N-terminal domain-containing protein, partial [Myxococcota bacterium]